MSHQAESTTASSTEAPENVRLRDGRWKRFVRGPDPSLLEDLYVPMLASALRYDRCCAYFSSSVLAAAARGFARLIERLDKMGDHAPRPAIRLVVNEQLAAADVQAMRETGNTSKLEELLQGRFKTPKELLEKERLAMLGWLVKQGLLEVRVGVMRHGEGIVHAKFGIATDESGDAIVFSGSGNEGSPGLLSNYERLEVSTSWEDPDRFQEYQHEFDDLWMDTHADVHTVTLPEALRLKLIKLAPEQPPVAEPSTALARQRAAMIWRFIAEAPYLPEGAAACDATAMVDLWPHQRRVVEETAAAWPAGRLLCDEVGMGKTIEAILVLRRLMAGRGVRRALLLLPAGLLKQWQSELREKGGLIVPRLEGTSALVWPDGKNRKVNGIPEALRENILLMSRETARTESNASLLLAAEPWDLVILDEAHAARRRKQEEGEYNSGTLLLDLLRSLQLRRQARGILLLSATPMQTHPWEPWDLLAVLGEGGRWLAEFAEVRNFYSAVVAVKDGRCDLATAQDAARLIHSDESFPKLEGPPGDSDVEGIAQRLAFSTPSQRDVIVAWLRQGAPLARHMHRNTKDTLLKYYERGMLPEPPPQRSVDDVRFDFTDPAERSAYEAVTTYIENRFQQLEQEKPGKGFVMTIYRRRAASSPSALRKSLERRRDGLLRVVQKKAFDNELAAEDVPEALNTDDLPEGEDAGRISAAFPDNPIVAAAELREVDDLLERLKMLGTRDSKRDKFFQELKRVADDGRPVLVFTEYYDTLEYLRGTLQEHYGKSLACYSGGGGERWDGESWKKVTKDAITKALERGEIQVLICTDAASEGLNLQAAGAVINYDLPWNPSRVEQRIGRIDRIGQKYPGVRVVNLFLEHSVDDQVYRVLRARCGLFEKFVGAMQPVLAHARGMLMGRAPIDAAALQHAATIAGQDPLAEETYLSSPAQETGAVSSPVTRMQMEAELGCLSAQLLPRYKTGRQRGTYTLPAPGSGTIKVASSPEALEHDSNLIPLSPLFAPVQGLADLLTRAGERLPLVIGSYQRGAFRRSIACWVADGEPTSVSCLDQLLQKLDGWDGVYPNPAAWVEAQHAACRDAEESVGRMDEIAAQRERSALENQLASARIRLQRELGRYLVCLDKGSADLNGIFYRQMSRDIASRDRLDQCFKKLGDYPAWPPEMLRDLESFVGRLNVNQRRARLLGTEIDAALQDPRWDALVGRS
ncbi:MAG: DEAD/DEAH box helicase [Terriglobia bacterium]